MKLIEREDHSDALIAFLENRTDLVSSIVARVEVVRAVRRARSGLEAERRAGAVVDSMALLELTGPLLRTAAAVDPHIRSLDAIHLASAMSLADGLEVLVTYDRRLMDAAGVAGIEAVRPES